jgi:hypothetical protein
MYRLTKEERKALRNATRKRRKAKKAVEIFRSGRWLVGDIAAPLLAVSGVYVLTKEELDAEAKAKELGIPKNRWER